MSTTPTTVTLSLPTDLAFAGDTLPITALVSTDGVAPAGIDGGTVTFRDGSTVIGTAPLVAGAAGIRLAGLGPGVHRFSATYGGTDQYAASRTAVDGTTTITAFAGTGATAGLPDGNPATTVALANPQGLAFDAAGNLYIADIEGRRVRRVAPGGVVSTVVGNGRFDSTGDGGPSGLATVFLPRGVAFDAAGDLYVSELLGLLVRKVSATRDVVARPRFTIGGIAATIEAGGTQNLTITAVDAGGNVVRDFNGTVRLSISPRYYEGPDGGTDPAELDREVTLVDGVATVPVTFRLSGPRALSVSVVGDRDPLGTTTINVAPGPLAGFRFDGPTAPVRGSIPIAVYVSARDQWGNTPRPQPLAVVVTTTDPLAQLPPDVARGLFRSDTDLSDGRASIAVRFGTPGPQTITITVVGEGGVPVPGGTGTVTVAVEAVTAGRIHRIPDPNGYTPAGPGLAGRTVYIDANDNGRLDDGETSAVSDNNGDYSLAGIARADAPVRDAGDRSPVFRNDVTLFQDNLQGPKYVALIPTSAVAPLVAFPVFPSSLGDDIAANYVRTLYRAVLGRDGSADEVAAWAAGLNAGQTREGVAAQFVNSPEHRRQQVDSYYRTFLKRDADVFSQVWVDQLRSGVSEAEVVTSILASPEYQAAHRDDASFVASLYQDGLGRDVDAVGRADGAAALAGGLSRSTLVRRVLGSEEAIDQVLEGFYAGYLGRRRDATSSDWAVALRSRGGSASAVAVGILASDEFYRKTDLVPRVSESRILQPSV